MGEGTSWGGVSMSKFDMGEFAKLLHDDVPESGTGQEQIEYINLDRIDSDPNNFYELSGVDALAANIELLGLQQPLRVRTSPTDAERVVIVSGHRRRAALQQLVDSGNSTFQSVPCIRERTSESTALQELRLIYANSDTRKMTSAELSQQAERVEWLLYQLKEEGVEFPGRMRDHVAEACNISKTKLGNLKVIRENLQEVWQKPYKSGELAESTALALARLSPEHQELCYQASGKKSSLKYYYESDARRDGERLSQLDALQCKKCKGDGCSNKERKWNHLCASSWYYDDCGEKCCDTCDKLSHCKYACKLLESKIKKLKDTKKTSRQQEKLAAEERDAPKIQKAQELWMRFGAARDRAGKTVEDVMTAMGLFYSNSDDEKFDGLENTKSKFTADTNLPYGYYCPQQRFDEILAAADLFGVSVDYLLCRTDTPSGVPTPVWQTAEPPTSGRYFCRFSMDGDNFSMIAYFNATTGCYYVSVRGDLIDADCLGWWPVPE